MRLTTRQNDFSEADFTRLFAQTLSEAEALQLLRQLTPEYIPPDSLPEVMETLLRLMKPQALAVPTLQTSVMDCCGTGGSGLTHYNTSTTVAFVLAAGGIPVVKFGNRSASSASGSFDFLAALGFTTNLSPQSVPDLLDACKLAFVFAPDCYPALKPLAQLRAKLKTPTLFNFLGPLLNPFNPAYRLLGVSDSEMLKLMAQVLANDSATQAALLVQAKFSETALAKTQYLDELAGLGENTLLKVKNQQVLPPEIMHWSLISENQWQAYQALPLNPQENAVLFYQLLENQPLPEAVQCIKVNVCLNAAAGFYTAGLVSSIQEGVGLAERLLREKAVLETFNAYQKAYREHVV